MRDPSPGIRPQNDQRVMRLALAAVIGVWAVSSTAAHKINISDQDIAAALSIARSTDADRARFHAPYIKAVNTPFVERAELISEFRRVVLLAEERRAKGDHGFSYSNGAASAALEVWRRRLSVVARVRFHPQNTYITVPQIEMSMAGHERALIGVLKEPVYALATGTPGDFIPIMGAVVTGVFEAETIGQGEREFVIRMDGKELGRVSFNLAMLE